MAKRYRRCNTTYEERTLTRKRDYHYSYLKQIVSHIDINPHSKYGKYVLKVLEKDLKLYIESMKKVVKVDHDDDWGVKGYKKTLQQLKINNEVIFKKRVVMEIESSYKKLMYDCDSSMFFVIKFYLIISFLIGVISFLANDFIMISLFILFAFLLKKT